MSTREKTLVASNDITCHDTLTQLLTSEYHVLNVSDEKSLFATLRQYERGIKLIVISTEFAGMIQYRLLRTLKRSTKFAEIPILVLASSDPNISETDALQIGASDFIRMPYQEDVFLCRVRNLAAPWHRPNSLSPQETDPTTGMLNRESFYEKAERLIRENPEIQYHIVCSRISNITKIRQKHVHTKIHAMYRELAAIFQEKACSEHGILGQLEDDQFAMCLPYHEDKIALHLLFIRDAVDALFPQTDIHLQFGIYTVEDPAIDVGLMCEQVLDAIRHTPENLHFLSYQTFQVNKKNLALQSELTVPLDETALQLHFHLYYDLSNSKIAAMEAVPYWANETIGTFSGFGSAIAKTGMFFKLDCLSLRRICNLIAGYPARIPILFTPTHHTLLLPGCAEAFASVLHAGKISPGRISILIPASDCTKHRAAMQEAIRDFRTLGFHVLLSSFGAESYRRESFSDFRVDGILLDFALLRKETQFRTKIMRLNNAIRMAKWIRCPLIVKNMTSQEELTFMRSIGASLGAVNCMEKPLQESDIDALLQAKGMESNKDWLIHRTFSQQDLWNPASPFNIWFDLMVGAALLLEMQQSILSPLRGNDSFFSRFHIDRSGFCMCSRDFLSFVHPDDKEKLLAACAKARDTLQEIDIQFALQAVNKRRSPYIQIHAKTKALFRTDQTAILMITLDEPPAKRVQPIKTIQKQAPESEPEQLTLCASDE